MPAETAELLFDEIDDHILKPTHEITNWINNYKPIILDSLTADGTTTTVPISTDRIHYIPQAPSSPPQSPRHRKKRPLPKKTAARSASGALHTQTKQKRKYSRKKPANQPKVTKYFQVTKKPPPTEQQPSATTETTESSNE